MQAYISIDLEVSDEDVLGDIIGALEGVLPYMADNVLVRSTLRDRPITEDQRRALFAAFRDVFPDAHAQETRYVFTRMVLGLPSDTVVSWSTHKPGALTVAEASKVLDALSALNV